MFAKSNIFFGTGYNISDFFSLMPKMQVFFNNVYLTAFFFSQENSILYYDILNSNIVHLSLKPSIVQYYITK